MAFQSALRTSLLDHEQSGHQLLQHTDTSEWPVTRAGLAIAGIIAASGAEPANL